MKIGKSFKSGRSSRIHTKKRLILLVISLSMTFSAKSSDSGPLSAQSFGLGATIGSPSGATAKYWIDENHAVDFNLGWGWGNKIVVWSDYLWVFPQGFGSSNVFFKMLYPYVGGGLLLGTSDSGYTHDKNSEGHGSGHAHFGFRLPLGVDWKIPDVPITIGAELTPTFLVESHTRAGFQFGISGRYYF